MPPPSLPTQGALSIRMRAMIDTKFFFPPAGEVRDAVERGLSRVARGLIGSEILRIAGEVRTLTASGRSICNLTVGDFSSAQFSIPEKLRDEIGEALAAGETNYPPSDGVAELRRAVVAFYEKELGLSYPIESVVIAGGSRPIIYASYRAVLDVGEKVLYATPSWNNNHYAFLNESEAVELVVGADTNFQPTAENLRPLLDGVRLLCLNTPLNPTGTMLHREECEKIAQLVVDTNRERLERGERPLYVMFDHVYWMLTFKGEKHWTLPQLVPEAAAWTIFIDGISKAFAATGLRVGWAVGPSYVISRMADILGHMGAWAPRPEQMATAALLNDREAIREFHDEMNHKLEGRLSTLHAAFQQWKSEGLPVDSVPPQGAIYLSAQFQLIGRSYNGRPISTNDEIRRILLDDAGFAVVQFQAFGTKQDDGWMRLSVGAASEEEIRAGLDRVREVLARVE
jgi:aspartate aminotransferase